MFEKERMFLLFQRFQNFHSAVFCFFATNFHSLFPNHAFQKANFSRIQLFRMIDSFFTPRSPVLPTHDSLAQLVDNFNDFFIERIHGLRRELDRVSKGTTSSSITDREAPQVTLSEFSQVSSTMIHHVIKALSTKSCPLDPMPTLLLKDHLDLIVPVVTDIVNESLSTGVIPTCLKRSLIRPLLKKQDLDRENLKNYRPIANIPFLSKVIEKAEVSQINLYLETNKLNPPLQSAYRKHHSTETALLRVLDGILMSLDHRQDVVLVMLDLSAAFDTLDHEILISRLGSYFGLSDTVLHWFSSYLMTGTRRRGHVDVFLCAPVMRALFFFFRSMLCL